jgi:hypothetical protein
LTTIAYKDGIFAYDSQTTTGHLKKESEPKVFRNGDLVFGITGHTRVNRLLKWAELPQPETYNPDFNSERWVNRTLVPAIRKELTAAGFENDDANLGKTSYMIYVHDTCFYVSSNFCVSPIHTFFAIGSGQEFAIAVMDLGQSAEKGVEVASRYDIYTGGPVNTFEVSPSIPIPPYTVEDL